MSFPPRQLQQCHPCFVSLRCMGCYGGSPFAAIAVCVGSIEVCAGGNWNGSFSMWAQNFLPCALTHSETLCLTKQQFLVTCTSETKFEVNQSIAGTCHSSVRKTQLSWSCSGQENCQSKQSAWSKKTTHRKWSMHTGMGQIIQHAIQQQFWMNWCKNWWFWKFEKHKTCLWKAQNMSVHALCCLLHCLHQNSLFSLKHQKAQMPCIFAMRHLDLMFLMQDPSGGRSMPKIHYLVQQQQWHFCWQQFSLHHLHNKDVLHKLSLRKQQQSTVNWLQWTVHCGVCTNCQTHKLAGAVHPLSQLEKHWQMHHFLWSKNFQNDSPLHSFPSPLNIATVHTRGWGVRHCDHKTWSPTPCLCHSEQVEALA